MFKLKITVMAILTEIYSFRLSVIRDANVIQDIKCLMGLSFVKFLWGTD